MVGHFGYNISVATFIDGFDQPPSVRAYGRHLFLFGLHFIKNNDICSNISLTSKRMLNTVCFFCFFLIFVGPRSILWGHCLPLFWTSCDPPHGFQSQGGSLTCTITCLCVVNLRVTSGATPAFSTNRGVHCISVYTAGPPSRHPSCKQGMAGNGGC